ncbi:putative acetyltransferase [Nonlabens sp. Hel1_33_55]|uniref:GNAT family N-acetyltransferase n=1 Tax=Nonlabens sp. Hel1_33_55 TaxID=1336802 RepID=UPI000875CA3C|nr:GNAT family N-acetyltransferase [Nonlabens sp. Hel1_33_55]SCY13681.1 putative acetyltransferase [Nonlabens sp. Hel1_33_55]
MQIRKIHPDDNTAVRDIIQQTILEHNAPKEGTAYSDAATQSMYLEYQKPRSVYYVVEVDGKVCGGAGVAALANNADNICELQKMYFMPEVRGKGYGKQLMEKCLKAARAFKFSKVYLETMGNMYDAQGLYKRVGFELLIQPLGNTGHYSCPVQMIKKLEEDDA